jgi:hypothetical protein
MQTGLAVQVGNSRRASRIRNAQLEAQISTLKQLLDAEKDPAHSTNVLVQNGEYFFMSHELAGIERKLLAILSDDQDFTVRELAMRVFAVEHPTLGQECILHRALTTLLRTSKARETGGLRALPGKCIHMLYAGSEHKRAGWSVRQGRPDEVVP